MIVLHHGINQIYGDAAALEVANALGLAADSVQNEQALLVAIVPD
jgi:hypothetical protein